MIFIKLQNMMLINYRREKKLSFCSGEIWQTPSSPSEKVNITGNKMYRHHVPPTQWTEGAQHYFCSALTKNA